MYQLVYFDLETTGLGKHSDIVQIAAVHEYGSSFATYIMPVSNITASATNTHGITKRNGCLYKGGDRIQDVETPANGLRKFFSWLRKTASKSDKKVILVAHNAFKFDAPVLINNCRGVGVARKLKVIDYVCDSLEAFKKQTDHRSKALENLMQIYNVAGAQTHDALGDAEGLKKVVEEASGQKPIRFLRKFCAKLSSIGLD
jgi:DNA polymerase III alpha subunit (gram-positive type)